MIIFYGEVAGIPLDWIVFGTIGIVGLMVTIAFVFMFRGGSKGPVEEDMALVATEDKHGTLQPGQLVGQCQRKEDTLLVTVPDWLDEEEDGPYTAELDIQKKVPFPFFDVSKALKRLWIVLDQGDLTVISFTTFLHGLPKRWDPPYADRRKATGRPATTTCCSRIRRHPAGGVLCPGCRPAGGWRVVRSPRGLYLRLGLSKISSG